MMVEAKDVWRWMDVTLVARSGCAGELATTSGEMFNMMFKRVKDSTEFYRRFLLNEDMI